MKLGTTAVGVALERLRADDGVIGVLQVGSSVAEYADELSDIDLEVVVDDGGGTFLPGDESGVEVLTMSRSELLAKRHSPRDLDHASYDGCAILHDPEGLLAAEIPLIVALPEDEREPRLLLHYWEFLAQARRVEKLARRDSELNARIVAGFAAWSAVRVLSVARGRWPPVVHWSEQGLGAAELRVVLRELARTASAAAARRAIAALDREVGELVGVYAVDRHALTALVYSDRMRPIRERYGMR